MTAYNNVHFIGRLGADAEIKGEKFVTFRIAVKGKGKYDDGTEKTNWFKIVFRGERAEKCLPYLTKGKMIALSCEAETNRWTDQNGVDRNDVQFAVLDVEFIPGQGKRANDGNPENPMGSEVNQERELYPDLPF